MGAVLTTTMPSESVFVKLPENICKQIADIAKAQGKSNQEVITDLLRCAVDNTSGLD